MNTQDFTQFVIQRNIMYICCKWSHYSLLPQKSYRIYTHDQTTKMPKNTSKFTYMKCHIKQEQRNEKGQI